MCRSRSWCGARGCRGTRSGSALRSDAPPAYRREAAGSKLDAFKDEIHRLLKDDPRLPGVRVRELIEPLGFDGGKTIVDDYLREVRPVFLRLRTHQRTVYRPGEVCQWDLWEPSVLVPVGHGQAARAQARNAARDDWRSPIVRGHLPEEPQQSRVDRGWVLEVHDVTGG